MPKAFSDEEKAHIHANLLVQGRRLFGLHGLRKTNVEDLTRAVGISKGAFYLFYDSKESLFFDILERFEAEYQAQMLAGLTEQAIPARDRLANVLRQAATLWRSHPLFAQFGSDDMAYLTRKLSPAQIEANQNSDVAFAAQFITTARAAGLPISADTQLLTGLLRALVLLNLHEDEIGTAMFDAVMAVLAEQIAAYLLKGTTP